MKKCIYLVAVLLVTAGAVSCKKDSIVREQEDTQSTGVMRSATIAEEGRPACQSALDDDSNWVEIGGRYWLRESTRCVEYDTESEAYNADWLTNNTISTSASSIYTPYYTDISDTDIPDCLKEQSGKLGVLYNWAAAVGVADGQAQETLFTEKRQGICPNGSHVPTKTELEILAAALGGTSVAGAKMKTSIGWESYTGEGDDGFAALPAGYADNGEVQYVGGSTGFWSVTLDENWYDYAHCGYLRYDNNLFDCDFINKKYIGLSVRCVRNAMLRPACQSALDDDSNWVEIGGRYWLRENTKCIEYDTESEAYNTDRLINSPIPTSASRVNTPYYTSIPNSKKPSSMSSEQFGKLGNLYNWSAAVGIVDGNTQMTAFTGNRQGICPNGSHIPSEKEWNDLADALDGKEAAGKKVKASFGWNGKGNGTDDYGFAALPAGFADGSSLRSVGSDAHFWTATHYEGYGHQAYHRSLESNYSILYDLHGDDSYGLSVRCIRNYPEGETSASPRPVCQSVLDDDSKWVKIGSQYWLKENTKCIEYDTESEAYNTLEYNTIPMSPNEVFTPYYTPFPNSRKTSYMTDDQVGKLGVLYNWAAAVGVADGQAQKTLFTQKRQGICPNGSHIPTMTEWNVLQDYLGGECKAGKKLKTTSGWFFDGTMYNGNGTDEYGFAALPAGSSNGGGVSGVSELAGFWTTTTYEKNNGRDAWLRYLAYGHDCFYVTANLKNYAYSVRCLKNQE